MRRRRSLASVRANTANTSTKDSHCFGQLVTIRQTTNPQPVTKLSPTDPEDFEMCFKVGEELTISTYAMQPRYGLKAGPTKRSRCYGSLRH